MAEKTYKMTGACRIQLDPPDGGVWINPGQYKFKADLDPGREHFLKAIGSIEEVDEPAPLRVVTTEKE